MITNLSQMYRCQDGNVVQFGEVAIPDEFRSQSEGRAVMHKGIMAIVRGPGMKNQEVHQLIEVRDEGGRIIKRPVYRTTRDRQRIHWDDVYKDQLKAWREQRQGTDALGTPLDQYPTIDVAQAAMLRNSGIHSLEQLSAVPDTNLDTLGPRGRSLRDGAKTFLESMTGNSALKAQIDALQAHLAAMAAAQPAPAKRGRKPKSETQAAA